MEGLKQMKTGQAAAIPKIVADSGKTAFIIDRSNILGTFFNYSAQICSVAGMIIENAMQGKQEDPAEIGDKMRQAYVTGCKHGKLVVFRFGQAIPARLEKYMGTGDQQFNADVIFDPSKNKERKNFAKIVKKEEDFDRFGGKELYPSDDFIACVLCEASEDDTVKEIIKDAKAKFPNFDAMFEVYENNN